MEVKQSDKQTTVGAIPDTWDVLPLGRIAKFSSGTGISVAALHPRSSEFPIPVYGGNGIAGYTQCAMTDGPTVAIGRVGQKCGTVYISDGPAWITDNALYPVKFLRDVDVMFLKLALEHAKLNDVKNRNDLPLVTQGILDTVQIAWPRRVDEQRAIAEVLIDVDGLMGGLERLIAKKRDMKQAAMHQLLTGKTRLPGFADGWMTRKLGEFTDCTAGGTPSTKIAEFWHGNIRWMNSGELHLKKVHDVEGRITPLGLQHSSTKMVPERCVLIGLAGQGRTRGTVAINLVPLCTNQSIAAIFPNRSFDPEYLYYNLENRYDELRELSAGDGGRGGLNLTLMRSLDIPFPSIEEQHAIATVCGDMDGELNSLEKRYDKLRAVKQGMMQQLLTGKVRLV